MKRRLLPRGQGCALPLTPGALGTAAALGGGAAAVEDVFRGLRLLGMLGEAVSSQQLCPGAEGRVFLRDSRVYIKAVCLVLLHDRMEAGGAPNAPETGGAPGIKAVDGLVVREALHGGQRGAAVLELHRETFLSVQEKQLHGVLLHGRKWFCLIESLQADF